MVTQTGLLPRSASIYELRRLRPEVRAQLENLGLTDEHLGYRISDAARAIGVPAERITGLVADDSSESGG